MARHFVIYKYNAATRKKVLLHEMVPEAIVDWLCEESQRKLSRKEKLTGWLIMKEAQAGAKSAAL